MARRFRRPYCLAWTARGRFGFFRPFWAVLEVGGLMVDPAVHGGLRHRAWHWPWVLAAFFSGWWAPNHDGAGQAQWVQWICRLLCACVVLGAVLLDRGTIGGVAGAVSSRPSASSSSVQRRHAPGRFDCPMSPARFAVKSWMMTRSGALKDSIHMNDKVLVNGGGLRAPCRLIDSLYETTVQSDGHQAGW